MNMQKFKKWWDAERVGRPEEDTSQDYCPTNGGAVCYVLFWSMWGLGFFLWAICQEPSIK